MAAVQLTVTPGTTFSPTSVVDDAKLNLAANPSVTVPDGAGIGPDHLDMAAVTSALGDAVLGVNYITRPAFWTQDWDVAAGKSAGADIWTENARDWFCRPTGGPVAYNRVIDSPDTKTLYAAELVGATGVTLTEFGVWVPSCILSELRGGDVVFSIYCKNMTTDPMFVTPFLYTADGEDTREAITEQLAGDVANLVEGEWQRVEFSLLASDYDTFKFGAYFGLRTSELSGPLKSLRLAQAQLELSLVATPFKRPVLPATVIDRTTVEIFGTDDRLTGANVLLKLNGLATMRYLDKPPAAFIKPVLGWNPAGYPEWIETGSNKLVFQCTKTDQQFTVPANGTMKIECWGAGGMEDVGILGGVGGYSWAEFACTLGTVYSVVVGEGAQAKHLTANPYGFGGKGSSDGHQWAGGGLSGVFTGSGAVAASDTARALVIAGAGGAGGQTGGGSGAAQGGNGNDTTNTGGEATMQGHNSTSGLFGDGGGGAGYAGGSALSRGGKGGTGFLHTSKTAGAMVFSVRPSKIVPGTSEPNYQAGIGGPQQPGLVVVTFTPGGTLSITTGAALPAGTHSVAYSTTLAESGGVPAYVWTVDSGTLPSGLTLSGAGVLSGTPGALSAGSYSFTIRCTDGAANYITKAFTLVIA